MLKHLNNETELFMSCCDIVCALHLTVFLGALDFEAILPSTGNYFAYGGSLTTPPLYECVKWILLREPIYFSKKELDTFRSLPGKHGACLCDNFRPPQPIHDRIVEANFDMI